MLKIKKWEQTNDVCEMWTLDQPNERKRAIGNKIRGWCGWFFFVTLFQKWSGHRIIEGEFKSYRIGKGRGGTVRTMLFATNVRCDDWDEWCAHERHRLASELEYKICDDYAMGGGSDSTNIKIHRHKSNGLI